MARVHRIGRKTGARSPRLTRALQVEKLESRELLASLIVGSDKAALFDSSAAFSVGLAGPSLAAAVPRAAALTDDAYEQNDTLGTARALGTLTATTTIANLVMADGADWYRFTTTRAGTASDNISIAFLHAQGDLDLELYNSAGQRVRVSEGVTNSEQVSLSGLAAGTFYIRVFGYRGVTNPRYSLTINPPRTAGGDDSYEQNDTFATARALGILTTSLTVSNLVMADGHDWFRFTMNGSGGSANRIAVSSASTQGDLDLELYDTSGNRLAVSESPTNGEQISLAGRAAGTYFVHIVGYNGAATPNYTLAISPGTGATPPSPTPTTGGFDIRFTFSGLSASVQAVFEQAAQRWESIIVGDLPNATYGSVVVDDLLIQASGANIDGVGNVLGQAGPDAFRVGSALPYHGEMEFDNADLASMQANGTLLGVIIHEIGHVLGIGTLWEWKGLLTGAGGSNPRFTGARASAEYLALSGASGGVPVENTGGSGTRDSHWRESVFRTEIMTGWVGPGTSLPISRVTIASLADLGYQVNLAAADPYSLPAAAALPAGSTTGSTGNGARLVELRWSSRSSAVAGHSQGLSGVSWATGATGQSSAAGQVTTNFRLPLNSAAVDALFSKWKSFAQHVTSDDFFL